MGKKDEKESERPVGWQINCVRKQSNSQTLATSRVFACINIVLLHYCCRRSPTITSHYPCKNHVKEAIEIILRKTHIHLETMVSSSNGT